MGLAEYDISPDAAKIIFRDSRGVIDAWYKLHTVQGTNGQTVPRYIDLLEVMAADLKVALRRQDIESYFFNRIDDMEQSLRDMHLQNAIQALGSQGPQGTSHRHPAPDPEQQHQGGREAHP